MAENSWIRHILVAVDALQTDMTILHTAVRLSAFLQADITGLFVEDVNLIRLSQLPFSQEVRYHTAGVQPLYQEQMQQVLKSHAVWLRHDFGQRAAERAVRWSFQVTRGFVSQELLTAAKQADLLIIGRLGRSGRSQKRVGSTALAAVLQADTSVLVVSPEADFSRPVVLLVDGSEAAVYALSVALDLAQLSKQLIIYIQANDEGAAEKIERDLQTAVKDDAILCSFKRWLPEQSVAQLWEEKEPGIVVIGHDSENEPPLFASYLLNQARFPVLFIRFPTGQSGLHPN